jgi:hypothetical protein
VAQSRNTPNSGPNSRATRSGLAGQRGDPYQWAGKVSVAGEERRGPVHITRQRSMNWYVGDDAPRAKWAHTEPRICLRPESGYD